MSKIRRIKARTKQYIYLLKYNEQDARVNCEEYYEDIVNTIHDIEDYIDLKAAINQVYCEEYEKIYALPENTLILKIKKKIKMTVNMHYLSRFCYDTFKAGQILEILMRLKERFAQYKYMKTR